MSSNRGFTESTPDNPEAISKVPKKELAASVGTLASLQRLLATKNSWSKMIIFILLNINDSPSSISLGAGIFSLSISISDASLIRSLVEVQRLLAFRIKKYA